MSVVLKRISIREEAIKIILPWTIIEGYSEGCNVLNVRSLRKA